MAKTSQTKITIRNLERKDFDKVLRLYEKIYQRKGEVTDEMLNGQISRFPEGQFVVTSGEEIIGHCASFIIAEKVAFADHSYDDITGGGFASRHDDEGEYIYGMEVGVDPDHRGLRIGQRLYNARKTLCRELGLKGIVFAGRMPNFQKKKRSVKTPEEYISQVLEKKIKDQVIGFQIKNGFTFIKVLKNYLPHDLESGGNAAFMLWESPHYSASDAQEEGKLNMKKRSVRVCAVQFQVREVSSFEEFASQVEYFVDVASDYKCDFVLFPEFLTIPLISMDKNKFSTTENIERLALLTEKYEKLFVELSVSHNINIIAGTHPTRNKKGDIENLAYVFLRDGTMHTQAKIHVTPTEKYWRNINGGDKLKTIETDCGTIGVLVCYDAEFPELSRHLVDQGMNILFIPFCTDEKQGYNRVRYCSQARAIENQIYVVMAGTVGNLPNVENMDVNYAESCIITPCDFPFARDGIAATSVANTEMIIVSDLNLDTLHASRKSGTVQNLKDRRLDLYRVNWKK